MKYKNSIFLVLFLCLSNFFFLYSMESREKERFITLSKGSELAYNLNSETEKLIHFSDAVINIIPRDKQNIIIDYTGQKVPLKLKAGYYNIEVFTTFFPVYKINNIYLDQYSTYLNIILPISYVDIRGRVASGNTYLGGVELTFSSYNGESYRTSSSIEGYFEINLPPNKYDLKIRRSGYELVSPLNIEVYDTDIAYTPIVRLREIPSYIEGYIYDTLGNPMVNTKLNIKNNDINKVAYTNMRGFYKVEVERGLVFIRTEPKGFFPTGRIERVEAFSTKKVRDIFVEEKLSSIYGTITNGILPLSNIRVILYDRDHSFIASVRTNNMGNFFFEGIRAPKEYYLAIDNPLFLPFRSEIFTNEVKERRNINIILEDHNVNFVVELVGKDTRQNLDNIEVIINDLKFKSDINGIVNDVVPSEEKVERLFIEIPSFNIQKELYTKDLGQEPYLIQIRL